MSGCGVMRCIDCLVYMREMVVHASLPLYHNTYSVTLCFSICTVYVCMRPELTWPELEPLRVLALAAVVVPVLLLPRAEGEVRTYTGAIAFGVLLVLLRVGVVDRWHGEVFGEREDCGIEWCGHVCICGCGRNGSKAGG